MPPKAIREALPRLMCMVCQEARMRGGEQLQASSSKAYSSPRLAG
ncbi:MAG: hypothetical protein NVS4B8_13640 [Herpetosiphon sp.]